MGDGTKGAGSGGIAGLFVVFLGQQAGALSLSSLGPSLEYLVIGIGAGAVLGGLLGRALGRRARKKADERTAETTPESPGSAAD